MDSVIVPISSPLEDMEDKLGQIVMGKIYVVGTR